MPINPVTQGQTQVTQSYTITQRHGVLKPGIIVVLQYNALVLVFS